MGVVTVSSSTSQTPLGLTTRYSNYRSSLKRPLILAFKSDQPKKTILVTNNESVPLPTQNLNKQKRVKKVKSSKRVKSVSTDEAFSCTIDLDYNEAAAKLENIYKLSPPTETSVGENDDHAVTKLHLNKRMIKHGEKAMRETGASCMRNHRKVKRLSLDQRISLRREGEEAASLSQIKEGKKMHDGDIERLLKEYAVSTDLVGLDWKKMKTPPVLSTSEHAWLFKLMQPMKALIQVKENLQSALGREPTDGEVAAATNMSVLKVKRCINVGQAARNKLIKHNLRLVMFVVKKYFQEFVSAPRYQDLCQAGVMGLITAIDRFEPERNLRLSTYGLFWIRHSIMRSMTLSSFTRVSFGLDSIRQEVQKAKLELIFELEREPTEEEITKKVGISPERYREVMRASKPVASLHSRHSTTQEELINRIADVDGIGGNKRKQPALLRLAIDDVLDSLKPKESLVIRQRYGLDGKGRRTLGEIAGNLNISREMVRKHELRALMKLKHPTRVDYLRRYVS